MNNKILYIQGIKWLNIAFVFMMGFVLSVASKLPITSIVILSFTLPLFLILCSRKIVFFSDRIEYKNMFFGKAKKVLFYNKIELIRVRDGMSVKRTISFYSSNQLLFSTSYDNKKMINLINVLSAKGIKIIWH